MRTPAEVSYAFSFTENERLYLRIGCIFKGYFDFDGKSVKYLGVIIDTNLNFSDHIKAVELKISRAVGVLCK